MYPFKVFASYETLINIFGVVFSFTVENILEGGLETLAKPNSNYTYFIT